MLLNVKTKYYNVFDSGTYYVFKNKNKDKPKCCCYTYLYCSNLFVKTSNPEHRHRYRKNEESSNYEDFDIYIDSKELGGFIFCTKLGAAFMLMQNTDKNLNTAFPILIKCLVCGDDKPIFGPRNLKKVFEENQND